MKRLNAEMIMSIIMVSMFSASLSAKTITVPEDEHNIQAAIDKANEGDTIFVRNGLYNETITLKEDVSLVGESTPGTIIKGNSRGIVITAANNTLIKNLTVTNGATGIRCENSSNTIEACCVKENKGTGIHTLISVPNIRNSLIIRNDWTGILCESGRSIRTIIEHNVIAENGYSGIQLAGSSEVLIQNNILFANKQFGVWASEGSRKSRIIYNNFFENRTIANYFVTVDRSNLTIDPDYTIISGTYNFQTIPEVLKGKGKDGLTIGIIAEAELSKKINDADGDNIIGDKDQCPSIAEDIDGFEDDDGCPDFDNDKDGIYDTQDQCRDNAEDFDNFLDNDGCNDPDNDNDGVPDAVDICNTNKETVNGYKDEDGCPDEVPVTK